MVTNDDPTRTQTTSCQPPKQLGINKSNVGIRVLVGVDAAVAGLHCLGEQPVEEESGPEACPRPEERLAERGGAGSADRDHL